MGRRRMFHFLKLFEASEEKPELRRLSRKEMNGMRATLGERIGGIRCYHCGHQFPVPEVHHIEPLSEGGTNKLNNLILLCPSCHEALRGRANLLKRIKRKVEE